MLYYLIGTLLILDPYFLKYLVNTVILTYNFVKCNPHTYWDEH
jgi:hypothetical protein